jgi:hypothetical protein
VRCFHRTRRRVARAILRGGFKDAKGTYMTDSVHQGVWLSDAPLDSNEGAKGGVVLVVEIPARVIRHFEWIEEEKPYREWLVPAKILNTHGRVSIHELDPIPRRARTLVRLRRGKGISRRQLAAQVSIDPVTLADVEEGDTYSFFDYRIRERLANVLGVPVTALLE